MRSTLLFALTACATNPFEPAPAPASLADTLAAGPIQLALAGGGSIAAKEKSGSGWSEGSVPLVVTQGALALHADHDQLVVDTATVELAPIAIPPSVIAGDASLTDVRLYLAAPATLAPAWQDDDHATASAPVDLVLDWSLTANNGSFPLGPQPLPQVPVTLTLAGDGQTATATLDASQQGMVWMWASLVELDNLALGLQSSP